MLSGAATLVGVLITGFAVGPHQTNCYLVAARSGGPAVVIDPGDEAVPTLEYYFAVNDLAPAAVLLTHGHGGHTASVFDLCAGWQIPAYLHPADNHLLEDRPEELIAVADFAHRDRAALARRAEEEVAALLGLPAPSGPAAAAVAASATAPNGRTD